jgi:hypothetical protein
MRHFYGYIQHSVTFLLLAGLVTQGCSPVEDVNAELLSDVQRNNGVERKLDEVALRQVEEYKNTGKFSSPLKMNVHCYKAYSRFSPANDTATNFAIKAPCSSLDLDSDNPVVNYMSKLFVVPNAPQPNSKIVEVQCGKPGYPPSAFDHESFAPHLAHGIFPECPPDRSGNRIIPMYRDYSLPRKQPVLAGREKVIQELDRISNQQVQEFTKTGQYSSTLSFNPECGRYISSLLDDGKTVVNWILPGYYCNYTQPDPNHERVPDYTGQYDFVSAVFAVENKQQRTITLSRIVCETSHGSSPDIVKHPPRLVNGVPVCSTDDMFAHSDSVKKVLAKQYLPFPTH